MLVRGGSVPHLWQESLRSHARSPSFSPPPRAPFAQKVPGGRYAAYQIKVGGGLIFAPFDHDGVIRAQETDPLSEAIIEGNVREVLTICAAPDAVHTVNVTNKDGYPPLVLAAACEDPSMRLEFVKAILDAGADANVCDEVEGNVALHKAVHHRDLALAKLLIAKGADLNIPNYSSSEYSGDKGWMRKATEEDLAERAEEAGGAAAPRPAGEHELVETASFDDTPLHLALKEGADEIIEYILSVARERELDLDARDASGASALHLALEEGDDDVTEQLLELGADATVSYVDFGGMMPLHYFCSIGRVRTVKLLLLKGGASAFCSFDLFLFVTFDSSFHRFAPPLYRVALSLAHQAPRLPQRSRRRRSATDSLPFTSPRARARSRL